ncbi:MAG: RsmE family RNA methyltransferase, partial [Polaromonas sp.]|nr:RsmE family RNA methyltransferase [Polaromonas sp.]
ASPAAPRLLLSLRAGTQPLAQAMAAYDSATPVTLLSGPEGGLSPSEEDAAIAAGFTPVTLGPRTLRAETAPLASLALLAHP